MHTPPAPRTPEEIVAAEFAAMRAALDVFSTAENYARIAEAAARLTAVLRGGGKILTCGNGGSMCDAMHLAEELSGRFRDDRPAFAALALSDPAFLTCAGNDYGFEQAFARGVQALGRPGDALVAISTSGNSPNVLAAARAARAGGLFVLGLTGKDGGALAPLCDLELRAPHAPYADRAQEIHIKIIHTLILLVEGGRARR